MWTLSISGLLALALLLGGGAPAVSQVVVKPPPPNGPVIRPDAAETPPLFLVQEQSGGTITGLQRVGQALLENTRLYLIMQNRRYAERIPEELSSCFLCHPNGHTNGSFVPGPDGAGLRYDAPSLRGAAFTFPYAFKRQLNSLERFIFTEIRAAHVSFTWEPQIQIPYTGGGPSLTDEELDAMAAFIRAVDFPPNPKLDRFGKLKAERATAAELRGQEIFFGKARCAECHEPPFYTDLKAYNLQISGENPPSGIINVPTLRGIRFSAPYFHDGRFDGLGGRFPDDAPIDRIDVDAALGEVVSFFNELLELQLTADEEGSLVAFLKAL